MTEQEPTEDGLPRLNLRLVVRKAATTYRERFWRVALPAICVLVPASAIESLVDGVRSDHEGGTEGVLETLLTVASATGGIATTLALVFYAGLLDRLVGAHLYGHEDPNIRTVLRSLPYRKLIVADLLLVFLTLVGLILLVVPGLLVFTLFCIVGPVINIEGYGVFRGFREAARLVRPRFGLAFLAVTVPVLIEIAIEEGIHATVWEHEFLSSLVLNSALAVVVLATVGLFEVVFAHELIARDRARRASAGGAG